MRRTLWVLLLVVTMALAGCGPAMPPAAGAQTEGGETFVIALPRIVVDFDQAGTPSIMGLSLADAGRLMGQNFPNFVIPPAMVQTMTNANIQHLEIRQTGSGLAMFANGKAMPYLGWSDASLQQANDLAGVLLSQNTMQVRKFMPILRRLGLDIVLRFPRQSGTAEVPLVNPDDALKIATAQVTSPASAIVKFEIKYDDRGQPGVLGITTADLSSMGINTASFSLAPSTLQLLQQKNIQFLELRSKGDGLFVYVNGQPLPNIVWDDTFLTNAADLYAQMNPGSPYNTLVKQFVPLINKADVGLLIHFPLAAGAKPIAAVMH